MAAQQEGGAFASRGLQQMRDGGHRLRQPPSVVVGERRQHVGDVVLRSLVEFREGLAAFRRQTEAELPAVGGKRFAGDQPALLEALHDPAEIAGIEPEFAADLFRRKLVAMRELVQHPRLGQRIRALGDVLVQHSPVCGCKSG